MSENNPLTKTRSADPDMRTAPEEGEEEAVDRPDLPAAARRALQEAEERRKNADKLDAGLEKPREIAGRDGPDPVRYGDWENKGIISDF